MTTRAGDRAVSREPPIEEELSSQRDFLFRDGIVLWNWKIQIQSQRNHEQCNQEAEHYYLPAAAVLGRKFSKTEISVVDEGDGSAMVWTKRPSGLTDI
jgi:hypothetical protein